MLEARGVSPGLSVTRGAFTSIQVNTDANGNNIIGDAANEPSIAIDPTDPNRIVIGWRQFDSVESNFRQAGWAYSHDAGATWTFPGVLEPGVFRSDPVLDSDADGIIYYYSLTEDFSCDLFRSTDGGVNWQPYVPAGGGDKAWMVIDRTTGIGRGNIYAAYTPRIFTRSTDGGDTFEPHINLPLRSSIWGTMSVGPDGELYVVDRAFTVARSDDAQDPSIIPTFRQVGEDLLGGMLWYGGAPNPDGLNGQAWVATDHSGSWLHGNVYVLGSVTVAGSDPLDIMFARSTDGGLTWSDPVRVNDDPVDGGALQWFGTMSVSPNGRIDAIWNDTRNTGADNLSELYYSFSLDGGDTWSVNVPVSPVFDSHVGWPNQAKIGDYYDMISDDLGANLAWAATFNGEQDVYFLRIPVDCDGNGVNDEIELEGGKAVDCNANLLLDVCERDEDCNGNTVQDICDIASGEDQDCNLNAIPDQCDIADGTSGDCDGNTVPDECEQEDCNENGIGDACDISDLFSDDCNSNGVPDECELVTRALLLDADFEDGLPPGWTASGLWHVTDQCPADGVCDGEHAAYFGKDQNCTMDTGLREAGTLTAPGVFIPPTATGAAFRYCSAYSGAGGDAPDGLDAAWVAVDGEIVDNASGTTMEYGVWSDRLLRLPSSPGQFVTLSWHFDSQDAASGTSFGWQVDHIQLMVHVSDTNDCNRNRILDECEPDVDLDGVIDACDNCIATPNDQQFDTDNDGVGDACDPCTDTDADGFGDPGFPANTCPEDRCPGFDDSEDVDGDGVPDACDLCPFPELDTDGDNVCDGADNCLDVYNPDQGDCDDDGEGDACELAACASDDPACADCDGNGRPDGCDVATIGYRNAAEPGSMFALCANVAFADDISLSRFSCDMVAYEVTVQGTPGAFLFVGLHEYLDDAPPGTGGLIPGTALAAPMPEQDTTKTIKKVIDPPITLPDTLLVRFLSTSATTGPMLTCHQATIGSTEKVYWIYNENLETWQPSAFEAPCHAAFDLTIFCDGLPDCNGNSVPDSCDIADFVSADCNANDIPDECNPGDIDGDGFIGLPDHADFVECMTGPCPKPPCAVPPGAPPCCTIVDFDDNGSIDLRDVGAFQRQFTGQ